MVKRSTAIAAACTVLALGIALLAPPSAATAAAGPCGGRRPAVANGAASLDGTTARVTAKVNPKGARTRATIEWGTTPSLGRRARVVSLRPRCSAVTISARLTGLTRGKAYYWRVAAASKVGRSTARTRVFVPAPAPAAAAAPTPPTPTSTPTPTEIPAGFPVLHAVNKSGTEYACAQGWGFFDGATDDTAIAVMAGWGINAVRVPLNEDCWLGINGVSTAYGGTPYRLAISAFVARLKAHGMTVILDLHWSAPGTRLALSQERMADVDHSLDFWASVAAGFADDPQVVFDLFNEPNSISWQVWRDGDATYAGMSQLIAAIRAAGADNWVIANGLEWGNDLRQWLAYRPVDPLGKVAAGAHVYNVNRCATTTCWDAELAPVALSVPLAITELGENDCAAEFTTGLLDWSRANDVRAVAPWAWNSSMSCAGGPSLVTSSNGTATAYGEGVRLWYTAHPA